MDLRIVGRRSNCHDRDRSCGDQIASADFDSNLLDESSMAISLTSRPAQLAALLVAGLGGPYAYYNGSELTSTVLPKTFLTSAASNADQNLRPWSQGQPGQYSGTDPLGNPASVTPLTNPGIRDFRQFLRFDISPGWVTATFPRVTTVLSNVQMDGLRVPVVTGTSVTDFAGTADYYFDRNQQIRRIILQGACGDPSVVASMLLENYGLKNEPSLGGHLYTGRWNNRITSVALIQPAPIVYANDNYHKFSLFIEINQPSLEYGLSEQAEQLLQQSWQNLRWH